MHMDLLARRRETQEQARDALFPGWSIPRAAQSAEDVHDPTELRIRNAQLDAQVAALKQILETERARSAELLVERDKWAAALEMTQRHIAQILARAAELDAPGDGVWHGRPSGAGP
jgi:hypothetical protein